MAFNVGSITGEITLGRGGAITSLREVKKEAQSNFKPGMEGAFKDVETAGKKSAEGIGKSYKEMLHGIKGELGRRSAFGESVELLAGGGVIMGASLLGEKMKELTAEARKFAQELKEGKADWDGLIGKTPVIGGMWEAGRNIREIMTGEAEETLRIEERTRREVEQTNAAWKLRKEILKEGVDQAKEWAGLQQGLNRDTARLMSGKERNERLDVLFGGQDKQKSMTDRLAEQFKDINAKRASAMDDYHKALEGIPDRYAKLKPDEAIHALQGVLAGPDQTSVHHSFAAGTAPGAWDVLAMGGQAKVDARDWLNRITAAKGKLMSDLGPANANASYAAGQSVTAGLHASINSAGKMAETLASQWLTTFEEGFKKSWAAGQKENKENRAAWLKDESQAKSLADAARTPFQKFADEIYEAVGLRAKGMLTGAQAGQIAKHSFEQFTGGNAFDARLPEAMKAGSYAEFQNTFLNRA